MINNQWADNAHANQFALLSDEEDEDDDTNNNGGYTTVPAHTTHLLALPV